MPSKPEHNPKLCALRLQNVAILKKMQHSLCADLSNFDGVATFISDHWTRKDQSGMDGGGGDTRILKQGRIFEQAGVNFSEVWGTLPDALAKRLEVTSASKNFYATGVSLVLHPFSPMLPTMHANLRYLEVDEQAWFGGGADLTPYYLFDEDATHFHKTLKQACDLHSPDYYPRFKKWCDEYFYLPHRQETRGVGGIFFDYLGKSETDSLDKYSALVTSLAECISLAYLPILEKRQALKWSEAQKNFQLLRRGRYVEFNLLYDRGTLFGLQTGGRTESILMSLPPNVRWEYCFEPQKDSDEARLMQVLKNPREWL